ncbi:unnamed protein product [Brachionus calyciflorus]|uniref:Uncharacterized protein n=1 Tax=Brachionus calyciflorus TaxID=104777 RepID=A0A814JZK8_9BILA|nr:unnamed protein product [Brachionus calyciflorus]
MNSNISSFKTNSTCFSEQKVRAPIICPKEISCTQLTNQYKHFTNTCAAIYLKNVSDPKPTSSEVTQFS